MRRTPLLLVPALALLILLPHGAEGQTCLGLPHRTGRFEVILGAEGQSGGARVSGRAQTNLPGRFAFQVGGSVGRMDDFAKVGYELKSLLSVSLLGPESRDCLFFEYEQAREGFDEALGQTSGVLAEHWVQLGWALGSEPAWIGSAQVTWDMAPQLIWRVTHMTGRQVFIAEEDAEVGVFMNLSQVTSVHLGGRFTLSVRVPREVYTWD